MIFEVVCLLMSKCYESIEQRDVHVIWIWYVYVCIPVHVARVLLWQWMVKWFLYMVESQKSVSMLKLHTSLQICSHTFRYVCKSYQWMGVSMTGKQYLFISILWTLCKKLRGRIGSCYNSQRYESDRICICALRTANKYTYLQRCM